MRTAVRHTNARGFGHEPRWSHEIEWCTPPAIFEALKIRFDLDVCAPPGGLPWIPADDVYSLPDRDGLTLPWHGRVWLNPPYSQVQVWIMRFLKHHHGIALVFARSGSRWAQHALSCVDAVCFLSGRVWFIRGDGQTTRNAAGADSMLLACGDDCVHAVMNSGLGVVMRRS